MKKGETQPEDEERMSGEEASDELKGKLLGIAVLVFFVALAVLPFVLLGYWLFVFLRFT